jgi:alkanesulfonate monooxygenase SsuD/methylene tetrahydromethanopterin reductase-like flavin-dependent oxidoreductase (luciferase family)
VHVSLFLGPNVSGPADDHRAIDLCIEQALTADAAGFAAIYCGEQHFNDYEPYSNPIVMAGYLAGQITQAYLGTSMIPLPQHHPLDLVERINLLDQLTRGRCIIGMSSGRPMPDLAFPVAMPEGGRAQLFDEKLDVMLGAWAHQPGDGPFKFRTSVEEGVVNGRIMPTAYRAGHPLFAIGTNTPAKVRAAGRAGHKVHIAGLGLEGSRDLVIAYREAMEEAALAPELIASNLSWFIHSKLVYVAETEEQAMAEAEPLLRPRRLPPFIQVPPEQERMGLAELLTCDPGPVAPQMGMPQSLAAFLQQTSIVGSPDSVAAQLRTFDQGGLEHMHIRFAFGPLDDLAPFRRSLDLFIREVMPRLDLTPMPPLHDHEVAAVNVG